MASNHFIAVKYANIFDASQSRRVTSRDDYSFVNCNGYRTCRSLIKKEEKAQICFGIYLKLKGGGPSGLELPSGGTNSDDHPSPSGPRRYVPISGSGVQELCCFLDPQSECDLYQMPDVEFHWRQLF